MDERGLQVTILPTITNLRINWKYDSNATVALVYGGWQPSQTYTVTIGSQSPTRYGETLGKDVVVRFTTAPATRSSTSMRLELGQWACTTPASPRRLRQRHQRGPHRLPPVPGAQEDVLRLLSRDSYQVWKTYRRGGVDW